MRLAAARRSAVIDVVVALDRFVEADARARKLTATAPLERGLQRAISRAFRQQGQVFIRRLGPIRHRFAAAEGSARKGLLEAIAEDDWLPYFDEAALQTLEVFTGPMRVFAERALAAGGRAAIADLGAEASFDLANPRAVAYLHAHAAERVAGINATTRDRIATIIRDGAEAGRSYGQIARDIKGLYTEFAVGSPLEHIASRAELVAVTEIGDAYEEGNRIVADGLVSAGLQMEKQWLDVGDRRVDPTCASNAAEGWIPLEQAFGSGHQQPTAHPGCRCTILYRRAGSGGL